MGCRGKDGEEEQEGCGERAPLVDDQVERGQEHHVEVVEEVQARTRHVPR